MGFATDAPSELPMYSKHDVSLVRSPRGNNSSNRGLFGLVFLAFFLGSFSTWLFSQSLNGSLWPTDPWDLQKLIFPVIVCSPLLFLFLKNSTVKYLCDPTPSCRVLLECSM